MMEIAVGLLHWPIRDRQGLTVATNITNLDVHDIARASKVYGVKNYFLIHPHEEQQLFVHRMLEHWQVGEGARYNPMRKSALDMVKVAPNLEDALAQWGPTLLIGTTAREISGMTRLGFKDLRKKISQEEGRVFLLFGTGFGMTEEVLRSCDHLLEPMRGGTNHDYRHLSVRSAVSICLDRLLGSW